MSQIAMMSRPRRRSTWNPFSVRGVLEEPPLDDDQLKILKALNKSGAFVVRGERELSLLETRRVLLYPKTRWAVHPTLAGLLATIPETEG